MGPASKGPIIGFEMPRPYYYSHLSHNVPTAQRHDEVQVIHIDLQVLGSVVALLSQHPVKNLLLTTQY